MIIKKKIHLFSIASLMFFSCSQNNGIPVPEFLPGEESEEMTIPDTAPLYDPDTVTLIGYIELQEFYGPPGYGESPETDSKEAYYIFFPDSAVNFNYQSGIPGSDDYRTSMIEVDSFQLFEPTPTGTPDVFPDTKVKLTGVVFEGHSGHHHTDLLIEILELEDFLPSP